MTDKVYTLREWAEETSTSYWFWWKLVKAGKLPCIRTVGKILVRKTTIEKWLSDQEKASVTERAEPIQYGTLRKID